MKTSKDDIYSGDLILVNAMHGIVSGVTSPLIPVHPSAPSILMCSHAADALNRLMREIDGWTSIVPVSGWRSREEQQTIWDDSLEENGIAFTQKYVAVPGHSEHQTGLAIDLGLRQEPLDFICPAFPDSGICRTFREKAAGHGFILRYPAGKEKITGIAHEPWHFRYVGIPHAEIMAREGLVLEEYIDFIRRFPYKSASYQIQCGGRIASVSYISADEGAGAMLSRGHCPAAENSSGAVSGNNVDGFILTEWRDADE